MKLRLLPAGSMLFLLAAAGGGCGGGGSGGDTGQGLPGGGAAGTGGASESAGAAGHTGGSSGTSASGGSKGGSSAEGGSSGTGGTGGASTAGASGSGGKAGAGATAGSTQAGGASGAAGTGAAGKGAAGTGGTSGAGGSTSEGGAAGKGTGGAAGKGTGGTTGTAGTSSSFGGAAGAGTAGSGTGGAAGATEAFDVEPSTLQTLPVPIGQMSPTVTYSATLNGTPVAVGWNLDQGNVATIPAGPSTSAVMSPTGTTGGLVNVRAGLNGQTISRQALVALSGHQNGANPSVPSEMAQVATDPSQLTAGGGVGGVGGEGLGVRVTDPTTLAALMNPSDDGSAYNLQFLYPYDRTVFPRGMIAPLLMWDWATNDADAIQISLSTRTGSFSWSGTFGRPTILGQIPGGAFIRHPIPEDIWDIATNTAGGPTADGQPDTLTVSLVVAKGGMAHGPISETWTVAPGRLAGTVYYQSYGTLLVKNYTTAVGGDGTFGAAVLSIKSGDTGPALVAGSTTAPSTTGCRTCHSVASGGSKLIAQQFDNGLDDFTSYYDLQNGNQETMLAQNGLFAFAALSPDGSLALTDNDPNGGNNAATNINGPTGLYTLPDGNPVAVTGLNEVATTIGTPTFSHDGSHVAFRILGGPGATAPGLQLMSMAFDGTSTFSSPLLLRDDSASPGGVFPSWPAFFPTNDALVYQDSNSNTTGSRSQLWWVDLATQTATALDTLNGLQNGTSYLPAGLGTLPVGNTPPGGDTCANSDPTHSDDTTLNFEPTSSPIASGGFAWVLFTSRRLYGSVATIPPYCSDPRGLDLVENITPKKLWISAIDLNAPPGTDPSHPAFYLPAQEILAGNSRGFWALDPCRADGTSCDTGDQCCNGYCEPNGTGGALVCSNTSPNNTCSGVQEKCSSASDCCDTSNLCINGFCAQNKP